MKFRTKHLTRTELVEIIVTLHATETPYVYNPINNYILTIADEDCAVVEDVIESSANIKAISNY